MFLLDSNVCIQYINGTSESVVRNMVSQPWKNLAVCSVVRAELLFGARRSLRVEENLLRYRKFLDPLHSFPFDDNCAEEYSRVRSELSRQGSLIGPNDLLIASIALAHDATLVTNNTREFKRVQNLRLEDWQEGE